ncbi:Lrp/AsnC family transcriptional regulator, partial [Streptomyces alkaliterrae]
MEQLDRQIVELLVKDGRMSYTDLGKATGLSTSAVHQRVRRLEQRGVIKGYTALIDAESVGLPMTAFISVKPFDPSAPDDIADRLADIPEIEACHSVAGDENYILKVRVATPTELENLLARVRTAAGVSTRTTVVLSTPYELSLI